MNKKILEFLKRLDKEEVVEGYVLLNGSLRSSKIISSDGVSIFIHNEIDDSEDEVSISDFELTTAGQAIIKNAFIIE